MENVRSGFKRIVIKLCHGRKMPRCLTQQLGKMRSQIPAKKQEMTSHVNHLQGCKKHQGTSLKSAQRDFKATKIINLWGTIKVQLQKLEPNDIDTKKQHFIHDTGYNCHSRQTSNTGSTKRWTFAKSTLSSKKNTSKQKLHSAALCYSFWEKWLRNFLNF